MHFDRRFLSGFKALSIALFISFFLVGFACAEDEDNVIRWYIFDMPPVYILDGEFKGQGNVDRMREIIQAEMSDYRHETVVANIARIMEEVRAGNNVVAECLLKNPDRESFALFSEPYEFAFPFFAVMQKSKVHLFEPYLTEGGALDFAKVLAESSLTFGNAAGRAFSQSINDTLSNYSGDNVYTRHVTSNLLMGLLEMILAERVDYTIAYQVEAYYMAKTMGKADEFVTLPILGEPEYVLSYAMLPDTEWGRKVLAELNAVLIKHRYSNEFREFTEFWMDDNAKEIYRRYMDDNVFDK